MAAAHMTLAAQAAAAPLLFRRHDPLIPLIFFCLSLPFKGVLEVNPANLASKCLSF